MTSTRSRRFVGLWSFLLAVMIPLPAALCQQAPDSAPSTAAQGLIANALAPKPRDFHEDWKSVSIETSTLIPDDPVFGKRDGNSDSPFTRELWRVSWRPGDPIDLYVVRPKGIAKPPVILYLYSFPTDTQRFNNDQWCMGAVTNGYAAVGFVSALTGQRLEYRPLNEWFVSELQEALATSAHDVQMVLNYLSSRGDFDMSRVGLFGEGSGASIAILASAADARIKALQLLTPWGDWPDWLATSKVIPDNERAKYTKPDFLSQVASMEPAVWLPRVKATSVRVEDVRNDPRVPEICQTRIEKAAPDKARIDQFGNARAAVNQMILEGPPFGWLKDHLEENPKSVAENDPAPRIHFYPAEEPPKGPMEVPPPPAAAQDAAQGKPLKP